MKPFDWRFALARFILMMPTCILIAGAFALWLYGVSISPVFLLIPPLIIVLLLLFAAVDWAREYIIDKKDNEDNIKRRDFLSQKYEEEFRREDV